MKSSIFLPMISALIGQAYSQGWSLSAYLDGAECGSVPAYLLADSVGGEWQCSDMYGKNPFGEVPAEGSTFTSIFWSGAEDCGSYPGGGCGNYVSELFLYSDAECTQETGSYVDYTCGEPITSETRYFMVKDIA